MKKYLFFVLLYNPLKQKEYQYKGIFCPVDCKEDEVRDTLFLWIKYQIRKHKDYIAINSSLI